MCCSHQYCCLQYASPGSPWFCSPLAPEARLPQSPRPWGTPHGSAGRSVTIQSTRCAACSTAAEQALCSDNCQCRQCWLSTPHLDTAGQSCCQGSRNGCWSAHEEPETSRSRAHSVKLTLIGSSQAVSAASSCSFSPFFSWLRGLLGTPTSRASACARRSWCVQ